MKRRRRPNQDQRGAASVAEVEAETEDRRTTKPEKKSTKPIRMSARGLATTAHYYCQLVLLILLAIGAQVAKTAPDSGLSFDADTNSYSGLTFTFDPRLDKRVEWLHFEHWLSIMQHSSGLLYEALNGRAHMAEVRVLIPYKWRQFEWPVLHKPGVPIIMNRRLRYADSDVIVGFDDPVYKETPYAVQHDECAKQGLNIHMPISFLEQNQPFDVKLKARLLVREFASHRYGIFKESGFRSDFMYPPFASLAGLNSGSGRRANGNRTSAAAQLALVMDNSPASANKSAHEQLVGSIRGFDEQWNECNFETAPYSGLPTSNSISCAPYLTRLSAVEQQQQQQQRNQAASPSFNLMSTDPFSYVELNAKVTSAKFTNQPLPLEWRDLADSVKWHFCGDNFPQLMESATANREALESKQQRHSFSHNQLATNKQNVMCNERSAMDVIKSNEDFRRTPFSPSTFNRLPSTTFKFLQEMPPRLILCVEYLAHLDHGILNAAITKFLAYDLISDTEFGLILFGQQDSKRYAFRKLEPSLDSRVSLYSPIVDPFDEPAKLYNEQELAQMDIQASNSQAKLVKGTCSFAKVMAEAAALQQQRSQYDDVGADIVIITSGLFIEDESKIEEILKSTNYRWDNLSLNLIIYPSTMLFDTKSRDGFIVLDAIESETIVKSRIDKLNLIQRLTGAKVHLVREHLDANGEVKMSTLVQFYQIFDHISKGHSWDQTHSMVMISQQAIEARQQANGTNKLTFQFEVDQSIQNELIVGFIDPKQQQQLVGRSSKRFTIKNLQLRSPTGYLVSPDCLPHQQQEPAPTNNPELRHLSSHDASSASFRDDSGTGYQQPNVDNETNQSIEAQLSLTSISTSQQAEPTEFPYRLQLGLAGFRLKAAHLAPLNASHKLAGVWSLTASSDEPIQTNAVALARVNPNGDTLTANCWIQSYHYSQPEQASSSNTAPNSDSSANKAQQPLKAIKVFVQTKAGAQMGPVQEVNARMEVQDELGNIVQNVNMLDDGLGVPDMTRGDGIHSQYVQRAHRTGYYKVTVELSGLLEASHHQQPSALGRKLTANYQNGQDNTCCGSFFPPASSPNQRPDTRHLNRQLYCGTFYTDSNNQLTQQRPPRINNLTVVNVDQDNRRVTIRWYEPLIDISAHNVLMGTASASSSKQLMQSENDLSSKDLSSIESVGSERLKVDGSRRTLVNERDGEGTDEYQKDVEMVLDTINANQGPREQLHRSNSARGFIVARSLRGSRSSSSSVADQQASLSSRYEIKLFSDREAIKRTFDVATPEVGFKFNEWNVEGIFPNASAYGGIKEVTLRIPYGREGVYYIAMSVYNNLGIGSQMSNIVQFWIKYNLTLDEAESIYGQSTTVDAEGNIYDKNGELIQRAGGQLNYSLLRGSNTLDGISILIFISVVAFVFSAVCITLVACLASSARNSLGKRHSKSEDKKAVAGSTTMIGAGSGSSMVSSGCGSSQQSEVASSVSGSQGGHDVEIINKLSMSDDLTNYSNQVHQNQTQLIHRSHVISSGHDMVNEGIKRQDQHQQLQPQNNNYLGYQQQKYDQHQFPDVIYPHKQQRQQLTSSNNSMTDNNGKANQWLQHTIVNGYAYATVNGLMLPETTNGQVATEIAGDLNQNGLSAGTMSPVQSWPADILLSHYDKVKQARERNEAPPVMRIETLEHQGQFSDGLPAVEEQQTNSDKQSYLVRQQHSQLPSSYFNQQLQQQLNSVLKSKQRHHHNRHQLQQNQHQHQQDECQTLDKSSPALDGVTELQDAGSYQLEHQMPPPQYVYCTGENGLASPHHQQQQAMILEPSIYSQVTNLQQVVSSADTLNGYYANQQWQTPITNGNQNTIYSAQVASEDYVSVDKSNSAISEV